MKKNAIVYAVSEALVGCCLWAFCSEYTVSGNNDQLCIVANVSVAIALLSYLVFARRLIRCPNPRRLLFVNTVSAVILIFLYVLSLLTPLPHWYFFLPGEANPPGNGIALLLACHGWLILFILSRVVTVVILWVKRRKTHCTKKERDV